MMIRIDENLQTSVICQDDTSTLILCIELSRAKFAEVRAKLDGIILFEDKNKAYINQEMLMLLNQQKQLSNYVVLMQNLWKQDHLNELNGDITLDVYWNCKLDNVNLKDKYKVNIKDGSCYLVKQNENLLNEAINSRIKNIISGCKNGGCGICILKILSGSYMAKAMSEKLIDFDDQKLLACQVYPLSDLYVQIPERKKYIISK